MKGVPSSAEASNSIPGSSLPSQRAHEPLTHKQPTLDHPRKQSVQSISSEHGGMAENFSKITKVVQAARRPLPTETGDGTYIEPENGGSLWRDLRALGIKDANTLKDLIENKAGGLVKGSGQVVDDKTMLMERIIQVAPTWTAQDNARY